MGVSVGVVHGTVSEGHHDRAKSVGGHGLKVGVLLLVVLLVVGVVPSPHGSHAYGGHVTSSRVVGRAHITTTQSGVHARLAAQIHHLLFHSVKFH